MNKKIKLSPSAAHKWLNCPGAINAEEGYENKKNKYSIEGTVAHKLSEICLKENKDPEFFINCKIDNFLIIEEMALYVKKYLNYIKKYMNENSKIFVEKKVEFEKEKFHGNGTLDCCIINNNICHIFDLKYGQGIRVSAKNNSQLKLYAVGIINFLNEKNINCEFFQLHIIQPRLYNFDNVLLDKIELIKFYEECKKKAEEAIKPDAKRIPGAIQCKWCLAKNDCETLNSYVKKTIFEKFDNIKDYKKIKNYDKKIILDNYDLILNLINSIKNEILEKLKNGNSFYDYKIKKGSGYRKWNENAEEILKNKIGEKAYKKKLIGIGYAQKYLTKEEINQLVTMNYGKEILIKGK